MGTKVSKKEKDYLWVWEDGDLDGFIASSAYRKLQQTMMLDKFWEVKGFSLIQHSV